MNALKVIYENLRIKIYYRTECESESCNYISETETRFRERERKSEREFINKRKIL